MHTNRIQKRASETEKSTGRRIDSPRSTINLDEKRVLIPVEIMLAHICQLLQLLLRWYSFAHIGVIQVEK
jgi:hypothetical protein